MSQYLIGNYRQSHIQYMRNGYSSNAPQPDPRGPRGSSSHNSLRTINRYPPSAQFMMPYPPQQRPPPYKLPAYPHSGIPALASYSINQRSYQPSYIYPQKRPKGFDSISNPVSNASIKENYKNAGKLRYSHTLAQGIQNKSDAISPPTSLQEEELELINSKKNDKEKSEELEKPIKKRKRAWSGCCSRKVCVISTFLICILIGVMIWLLYPKVPSSSIETIQVSGLPQVNNEQLPYFFNATLIIRVTMNNYNLIPISLSRLEAVGYDSNTNSEIGKGIVENVPLPGQRVTSFEFPYVLTYFFGNISDPTWIHLARSCVPTLVNFPDRSAMAVRFMGSMWFPILSWTGWVPKVTYQGNFVCPEP